MNYPDITIVIVTYNRSEEIRHTIKALLAHVKYDGHIHWLLADDGSPGNYVQELVRDFHQIDLRVSTTMRGGWGRNVNNALRMVETDIFFLCEDDYVSLHSLDFNAGVSLLMEKDDIGLVRYDGVEGHDLDLALRSHRGCEGIQYATVLISSPTLYVYSNRPHLCHRRFHIFYGIYPEKLKLGETEESFAHIVKNGLAEGPKIAILHTGIPRAFDHIGRSYQLSADDITLKES